MKTPKLWIIGYGNPQRRDDGIGPYVVTRLKEVLKDKDGIHLLALHQLEPDLIEDLRNATQIILIDATIREIEGGWQWIKVKPQLGDLHYFMHHIKPAFFLCLLQSIYHKSPMTWLISVQGEDFDFGEGLTPRAEKRAYKVITEVVNFINHQGRIFRSPNVQRLS